MIGNVVFERRGFSTCFLALAFRAGNIPASGVDNLGRTFDVQALRRLAATYETVRVEDNARREPVVEMVVQLRAASMSEHIIGLWPSRGL